MLATQRYPLDFDGVISGDPAMRTGYSNLADAWITVALNQIAPKDDAGKPIVARALSDADKKLVVSSLLEQCDAADGLRDGMIFNIRGCHFDPAVLTCKGAKTETCLTSAQVNAIQKGFAGPKTARGVAVYSPFPFDTGIAANGPGIIPGLLNPGPSPVAPPNLATQMDVDEAAAAVAANSRTALTDTVSTDLSTFFDHGGKLIFYHGMSDPWFSPARYSRLLSADGPGEWRPRSRGHAKPHLPRTGNGTLCRRHGDPGSLRCAQSCSRLGRERHSAGLDHRNRPSLPGAQPAVVRLAEIWALQRQW
jgi:feruloyl esterase